ncbi:GrpB family protein [Mesobacillus foraminis]|uniref:GrpB family protein n=1 Tax=Mesobacillus foraminis TaxID=279826 RepID=UPI0039A30697
MNRRKVEVVPYSSDWSKQFKKEQERLMTIFIKGDVVIHHIGSTSVPGLSAKPIIDILIEAENLSVIDFAVSAMENAGYVAKGENGIPGRRYFQKSDRNGVRLYHVHGFAKGSYEVYRHLVFRDFLRAHPDEAHRYAEVKERAAARNTYRIDSYIQEKSPIIVELEKKARDWRPSTAFQ